MDDLTAKETVLDTLSPKTVIKEHIARKCDLLIKDPDTVVGHLNHERSVSNDYRGRVLFELLQNAVDRAKKNIWVSFDRTKRTLIVANDGQSFAFEARGDEPRSDFAALCAIDTSNKAMGKSIGNKGVGFKSIWSISSSVQIRTRYNNEAIGFRLRWPFNTDHLLKWHDQELAELISISLEQANLEDKHKGSAPSFYFPELLENPTWQHEDAVTAIEIEELDDEACENVEALIKDLMARPLIFVSSIRENVNLTLNVKSTNLDNDKTIDLFVNNENWLTIDVDVSEYEEQLSKQLLKLGVKLNRQPKLTIALPKNNFKTKNDTGFIHSYLPTNQKTKSEIEIHGDFYLESSRKSADFSDIEYNKTLLKLATGAIIDSILNEPEKFASLDYALNLLNKDSIIYNNIKATFLKDTDILVNLLKCIFDNKNSKTVKWYNDLYSIIDLFFPVKIGTGRYKST